MSARTHSVPPAVELEVEGPNRDLAVIVVDLEAGGAIARSIVRDLVEARVDQWLADAVLYPGNLESLVDRILGAARPAFRLEFTPDAATDLRDSLTTALDAAESECASDGCSSIAVIDGHCAADDERLNTRRAG
jgi:hypothetical protein